MTAQGDSPLFPILRLPPDLVDNLQRLNPWWTGKAAKPNPPTRRHLVEIIHGRLRRQTAPAVVVRGPRQVGKTTAQLQVIEDLLADGWPPRNILRVQFDELPSIRGLDEPVLRIVDWFEQAVLKCSLNDVSRRGEPSLLVLDEVQNVDRWAEQLKSLVDATATQVLVTGSSALRIEKGRDSLAGRITTIGAGVLSLTEVARFRDIDLGDPLLGDNGVDRLSEAETWRELIRIGQSRSGPLEQAFRSFSERGGYPLAHRLDVPWSELSDQLNETVIQRVLQHDIPRLGERGRKRDPVLVAEVFRLVCRYAGQSPGVRTMAREVRRALDADVGHDRIRNYLKILGDALLVHIIEPLEIRLKKQRGDAKLCLVDHALRAAWLHEQIPLTADQLMEDPQLTPLAGHIAESVVGACLSSIGGLGVAHLPARNDHPEIDFILTVGTRRIPVEVKYQRRLEPLNDTEALRTFLEQTANNAPFGLLVTQAGAQPVTDPRIITIDLPSLLLLT